MAYLNQYGYGLWGSVIANIFLLVGFTYSIFRPQTRKEWRSMGAFAAFAVALFTEMYGFPLTIYVLTSVLGSKYPVLDPFTHLNGHLWVTLFGGSYEVFKVLHPISNIVIYLGLFIIYLGWKGIHGGHGDLITKGIYSRIRHPQYTGFMLTIIGFLIQWPTIITLIMAPVLFSIYMKLAKREEAVMIETFGKGYIEYMKKVPAFVPKMNVSKNKEVGK